MFLYGILLNRLPFLRSGKEGPGPGRQQLWIIVTRLIIYPVSSKVEHSTDNRKTEERYLYWVPVLGSVQQPKYIRLLI